MNKEKKDINLELFHDDCDTLKTLLKKLTFKNDVQTYK
jgi:hypothetical protein